MVVVVGGGSTELSKNQHANTDSHYVSRGRHIWVFSVSYTHAAKRVVAALVILYQSHAPVSPSLRRVSDYIYLSSSSLRSWFLFLLSPPSASTLPFFIRLYDPIIFLKTPYDPTVCVRVLVALRVGLLVIPLLLHGVGKDSESDYISCFVYCSIHSRRRLGPFHL